VKRGVLAIGAGLLASCALLGFAASFAIASSAGPEAVSPGQTTEPPPPPTEPPPPPTEPPPPPPTEPPPSPPAKRPLIAPGVMVGDLVVGWLSAGRATELVSKTFSRPLVLVVSPTRRIRVAPQELGAHARIEKAIRRAKSARSGVGIPLEVEVSRAKLRRYIEGLAKRFDREAVDAGVVLRGVRPRLIEAADGRHLKKLRNGIELRIALATHLRDPIQLEFVIQKPKVAHAKLGAAVVILRDSKRLLYYSKQKLERRFGIATGQSSYPTPTGDFEITTKQRNPWWYPPPSPWASESNPVPPGPGNPLGTRWMGISSPYVGIHGTPDSASIGYSASHGCVRMRIEDAEWLFQRVQVGTPVFILSR
jgi:lipoprotein-anchoring transpeptidase ErfK/SrfK